MQKAKDSLDEFFGWWRRKVDSGESSSFDRLEAIAIEIFADWLDRRNRSRKSSEKQNKIPV